MEAKEILMKKAGFLLALICILSLTGCGMVASAEEEIFTAGYGRKYYVSKL